MIEENFHHRGTETRRSHSWTHQPGSAGKVLDRVQKILASIDLTFSSLCLCGEELQLIEVG